MENKKKKGKLYLGIFFLVLGFIISFFISPIYIKALSGEIETINLNLFKINEVINLLGESEFNFWIFILFAFIILCGFFVVSLSNSSISYKSGMMRITDNIEIPLPTGQKQYGSASFLSESQKEKSFQKIKLTNKQLKPLIEQGLKDKQPIEKYVKFKNRNNEVINFYNTEIEKDNKNIKMIEKDNKNINSYVKELSSTKNNEIIEEYNNQKEKNIKLINELQNKISIAQNIIKESSQAIDNYKIDIDTKIISISQIPICGIPIEMISKTQKMLGFHKKTIEEIKVIYGDVHSLIIGATRSGKSRTLVLQNICMNALKKINMILSDPKGELYQYTYPLLKRLGYNVITIDFKDPLMSHKYNFLQFVIEKIEQGDIPKAISCCWDIVDSFVKEGKTDPLWPNGEKAVMAAAIMMVVYDNSTIGLKKIYPNLTDKEIKNLYETKHKYYQNICNVYNFVSNMTKKGDDEKTLILTDFIDNLPSEHPSKLILAAAESAAEETRGSFVTSALATLRLFTDPNIANMTNETKEGMFDINKPMAIFMILPDEKETYYPLASMITNQYYQYLVDVADKRGGRLPINFEFILDEFGNFAAIPGFANKMTVGAGRGIHFQLYIQSIEQLSQKYEKEVAGIIMSNCHYTVYLKTYGAETLEAISKRLGSYTVFAPSDSTSSNSGSSGGSDSSSKNLMSRSLLFPDEIGKINRPYMLIITVDNTVGITKSPDLSRWMFNDILGLGTEEHNVAVRELRQKAREKYELKDISTILWDFKTHLEILKKINMKKRMR